MKVISTKRTTVKMGLLRKNIPVVPGGGGGTAIYGLYRYVLL